MLSTINTNLSSLAAYRNLGKTQSALATSMQRLSSGLRVNSAKDDAAGLAIGERMTSQIRGMNVAARNANDGISLVQVAEGTLQSSSSMVQRIRELSVQSANATNSPSDRQALNLEAQHLVSEIQRQAKSSEFNGIKLLDGTFTEKTFQVGANAGQTISVTLDASTADRIGGDIPSTDFTAVRVNSPTGGVVKATNLPSILTGPDYATTVAGFPAQTITVADSVGTSHPFAISPGDSAENIASTINAALAPTATATATNSTSIDFSGTTAIADGDTVSFKLVAGGVTTPVSFTRNTSTFPTQEAQFANAINSASPPYLSATPNVGSLTLAAVSGQNIGLEDFAVVHNSSLMTNPTVTLSFTGTSVAPAPAKFTITLTGISGAGDQLDLRLGMAQNGIGSVLPKNFSVPLANGASESTNAAAMAAAINDPTTGFGPGTATATGGIITIVSPLNNYMLLYNGGFNAGTFTYNTDLSHGTTAVMTESDYNGLQPITTGGSESNFAQQSNNILFDITSSYSGGIPHSIVVPMGGSDTGNANFVASAFQMGLNNSLLGLNWTVTQSGNDVNMAHNGNTDISFSNGSQSILGVPGDSTGTGFTITTSNGVNTTGNGNFSISAADVETFGSAGSGSASIIFGGKTVTEGTANDSAVQMGSVSVNMPNGYTATSSGTMNFAGSTNIVQVGQFQSVLLIDISTVEGATRALNISDGALNQINGTRGYLGAVQNRFESVISTLGTSIENQSAARSRIMDADYALETAELARSQILQQAGMAMIAQANQLPQQVISLLKG